MRLGANGEVELRYRAVDAGPRSRVLLIATGVDGRSYTDKVDITSATNRHNVGQRLAERFPALDVSAVATALEGFASALVASNGDSDAHGSGSSTDQLVALVVESGAEFFHTHGRHDRDAYIRFAVDGHPETARVQSTQFKHWLVGRARERHGRVPANRTVQDAIAVLVGMALYQGAERTVAVRVAQHEDAIWIDLADAEWRAVKVTGNRWEVVASEHVPVRFVRPAGMRALPIPCRGGDVNELRQFINVRDDVDWTRILVWLVGSFRPEGPFIILVINGEQGSAKSCMSRMLRALIDPNQVPLRRPTRGTRDLMVAADNSWMINLDNLSKLSQEQSDDLCTLSTGGGFGTRALYSDDEEQLFDVMRPVALNGIDELATYPDLLDRSLVVLLPMIPPRSRTEQKALLAKFEEARPRILGALLDAVASALRRFNDVKLESPPRMADSAKWATAAEEALGLRPGAVARCFEASAIDASSSAIESSPIGSAIVRLVQSHSTWKGTATALLQELERAHRRTGMRLPDGWPRGAQSLSRHLRRLKPNLRQVGIEFRSHTKVGVARERQIELFSVAPPAVVAAEPSPTLPTLRVRNEALDTTASAREPVAGTPPVKLTGPRDAGDGGDAIARSAARAGEAQRNESTTLVIGGVA